jgi:5S rRNA maturation endonuclease (ribonuclease M5)
MKNIFEWDLIQTNKTNGQVKIDCPVCDHKKTKSLSVNLNKGVAKCHYCEAISIRDKESLDDVKPNYTLPDQSWSNYTDLSDKMVKWIEKERKIQQFTLKELRVTEEEYYQPQLGKKVNNIVYNYFEGDVLVNKKYRSGGKHFTQSKNGKSIFYNINAAIGEKEVYIVEGEFDVLAMHQAGYKNVISLPNGANDNDDVWINSEKYLSDVEKFYIATDNDTKGELVADKIVQRLGKYRCVRVLFKHKDANETLIVDSESGLARDIANAKKYPSSGTYTIDDLYDGIIDLYDNGTPETLYPKRSCFGNLSDHFKVMRGHLVTGTGIPSHGKALDINTKIPTPDGFVMLKDLKVGSVVFDEKGNPCNVVWKSEVFRDRPTYELKFSDNSTIIADENHEWLTETWRSRRGFEKDSIKTTKEIVSSLKTQKENRNNHSVLNALPIKTNEKNLEIDPYVLGCWLGDGNSADGGFTNGDPEIAERIRSKGYQVNKRSSKYSYGIIGIKESLRKLNLIKNKHIPVEYLFASVEQRYELLRGLMDTDGHCSIVEARNEFCSVKEGLAKDFFSLICSLGIKATFVESDAFIYEKYISKRYRIFFKADLKIYNLSRKQSVIDKYFESGRKVRGNNKRYITEAKQVNGYLTQCIEVDSESHLFLAGEQFIPTHNSNFTEWYVLNLVQDYNLKASFFSPEHHPMELHQTTFIEKFHGKNFWMDNPTCPRISKEDILTYSNWAKEKIYITSPEKGEFPKWEWLLEKFKEQMFIYGIDIFIIDAFNKLEFNNANASELSNIKSVLTKLTMFAQMNNVIIFLIAHPTKMTKNIDGSYNHPDLYSVSGSADFRNQTHDGFSVFRYFKETTDPNTNEQIKENQVSFRTEKVKMKFQGSIGSSTYFNYHLPSGRYYVGNNAPTFRLDQEPNKFREEYIPEYKPQPHEAFDINSDEVPF